MSEQILGCADMCPRIFQSLFHVLHTCIDTTQLKGYVVHMMQCPADQTLAHYRSPRRRTCTRTPPGLRAIQQNNNTFCKQILWHCTILQTQSGWV